MGSASDGATATRHPLFARAWVRLSAQLDRRGGKAHRARLLAGLGGEVVEVGAGHGLNFAHYPPTVTRVVAVEPEAHLRHLAADAAAGAPVPVEVVDATSEALPLADGSVDAAVTSLVLCSVSDPDAALAEIARVLRPGGVLRLFEHVAAHSRAHRGLQRALDATVWPRLGGNCHTARDPVSRLDAHGLALADVERFRFPDARLPMPTSPHVLAEATAP